MYMHTHIVEYSAVKHRRGLLEILAVEAAAFVFMGRRKREKIHVFSENPTVVPS